MSRPALDIAVRVPRRGFDVMAELTAQPGERLALFGPSGAGKTTLVDTVAGLVEPADGAVRLGDDVLSQPVRLTGRTGRRLRHTLSGTRPRSAAVRHVSVVRQPAGLFPHLDVASNVAYGNADRSLAAAMIERLSLAEHRHARPGSLSGGQAQRVALARALARRFSLLLLDEPVSALDRAAIAYSYATISERCDDEEAVALLVTHDLEEAQAFGDRMAVMDRGAILAIGDPHELVAAPATRRLAELVGYRAFLSLRGPGGGGRRAELAIDDALLQLGETPGSGFAVRGTVASCRPAGTKFLLSLMVQQGSPVGTTMSGDWVTALTCELPVRVATPVTVGKEILATARMPPVVQTQAAS